MASRIDTGLSTATKLPAEPSLTSRNQSTKSSTPSTQSPTKAPQKKHNHASAIHKVAKVSPLSYDAPVVPSFFGFQNLMALMLIVSNLRLMIENSRKYGFRICLSCHEISREDLVLGSILYFSVPFHLLVAYIIELVAAQQAKSSLARLQTRPNGNGHVKSTHEAQQKTFQVTWYIIAFAHAVNATLNLAISTWCVYYHIFHPAIGAAVELHATITWLKVCSYAFANRDLRHALLYPELDAGLPDLYASCPYPENITLGNLCYFWWAPTLVYQPVYPRTSRIRRTYVIKRAGELVGLSVVIWLVIVQYASPLLHNSMEHMHKMDMISIMERVLKLSTISLFCWLCGFYALFHSFLNLLAEVMRFADREFYSDWWNVSTVREYWTSWNKPVYAFMKRHIYSPLVGRGVSPRMAQLLTFIFSGVLHELLIGIPTHNIIGAAFAAMIGQVPFILITDPFGKSSSYAYRVTGNAMFWLFFCIFGQPIAAMVYFFSWQKQYGQWKDK
ncbi:putative diacylglycerol O-acyltransferase [Microthyrium microscopicum]|uniref:O-acyltransferase n=1 Tax=Microthyrium microscopicum TaxID=703497 RepID=A0A6A6UP58_9PEZI|nr:putative diacylglycerol O-acyltransferase [Microthyrium microscopicum]